MKCSASLLLAIAAILLGAPHIGAGARVKDPPPPIFVAPTPSLPPPPPEAPLWIPPSTPTPAPAPAGRTTADLEKLAAPIALHPDPLIASILTAAAYPLEIVQAARFVADTNNVSKIDAQPWDANVKTVARIPALIQKMNEDLNWTTQLGQAFIEQPLDLMNAMQSLRTKAVAAGTLKTTPEQVVTTTNAVVERTFQGQVIYVTNTVIQVQPAKQDVVYIPSYNPSTVYVYDDGAVAAASFISFGVGIAFGSAFWGHCDWFYGGCYWGGCYPYPPACPPPYYCASGNYGATSTKAGGRPLNEVQPASRPVASTAGLQAKPLAATSSATSASPAQRWQPDPNRLRAAGATTVAPNARGSGSHSQVAPRTASVTSVARPSQMPLAGAKSVTTYASPAGPRPVTSAGSAGSASGSVRSAPAPSAASSSWRSPTFSPSSSVSSVRSSSSFTGGSSLKSASGSRGFSSGGGGARSVSSMSRGPSNFGGGGSRGGGGRVGR